MALKFQVQMVLLPQAPIGGGSEDIQTVAGPPGQEPEPAR